jgi:hypothetical protein
MVEVWYGDEYLGMMTYDEFLDLYEADPGYVCVWASGYGP